MNNILIAFAAALCVVVALQWHREAKLERSLQELTEKHLQDRARRPALEGDLKRTEAEMARIEAVQQDLHSTLQSHARETVQLRSTLEQRDGELMRLKREIEALQGALAQANASIQRQNEGIAMQNAAMKQKAAENNELAIKYNKLALDFNALATKWNAHAAKSWENKAERLPGTNLPASPTGAE